MKKKQILKAIIAIIRIAIVPISVLLILLSIPVILFYDVANLELKIMGVELLIQSTFSKVLVMLSILFYLQIIYSLHLFPQALCYFFKTKVFDVFVIDSFWKIGNTRTISGVIAILLSVIGNLYFGQKLTLEFGLNAHVILIALGLFFMILSDAFNITQAAKQENDLSI